MILIISPLVAFSQCGSLVLRRSMSKPFLQMLPGTMDKPTFPLNLIADFAGGGLLCANGILLAIIERGRSGRGQVVNVDMVSAGAFSLNDL
jgi:crotonobetainyl-CoA:carnitine CoA-transferase CaiB-like acyl-CoA transferase